MLTTLAAVVRTVRRLVLRRRYYAIIGGYTGEVIGRCTGDGIPDVLREEPRASFRRISRREFNAENAERQGRREAKYPERSCSPIQSGGDK